MWSSKTCLIFSTFGIRYSCPFLYSELLLDTEVSSQMPMLRQGLSFRPPSGNLAYSKNLGFNCCILLYPPIVQVLMKVWKDGSPGSQLQPSWKGPLPVLMSSPTAIKVSGMSLCIYHSWMKPWKELTNASGLSKTMGQCYLLLWAGGGPQVPFLEDHSWVW